MRLLLEFGLATLIISLLAGATIVALPLFTIWTVLPIFAFAVVLHLLHGLLYTFKDRTKPDPANYIVKWLAWAGTMFTTSILIVVVVAKAALA